ncbi:MAG: hypothetical protein GXO79_14760 [Chlorobi bacterium]|nr:hypothetical protein [Chlorobiota bacterium]
MNKSLIIFLVAGFILFGWNKEEFFCGKNNLYEDFEGINKTDNLFLSGNWEYYQQTIASNFIEIDTNNAHSGNNCLKIFATKGTISKSDIANNKMAFWENDIVQISAWFYLQGTDDLNYVFLFDIEENAVIGASPGIRIAIDDNDCLLIERNKYGEPTIQQTNEKKISFPRNQWVELKIEIDLKQKDEGYIKLWQDDVLLINATNIETLPKDKLYFIQGTKGMYQSIQIGVTATTSDSDVIMFLDDIEIKVVN